MVSSFRLDNVQVNYNSNYDFVDSEHVHYVTNFSVDVKQNYYLVVVKITDEQSEQVFATGNLVGISVSEHVIGKIVEIGVVSAESGTTDN